MTSLVTGANGAIGGAIVAKLLQGGHRVLAHDLRFSAHGPHTAQGVARVEGDLSTPGGLDQRVHEAGSIDRVIAAHGVDGSGKLVDLTDSYVERVIRINAASIALLLTATRPCLRASRGSFTVVVSQAGLSAERHNVAYCASKFAVIGWAAGIKRELQSDGISMRLLCLGCIETPLFRSAQERFAKAAGTDVATHLAGRLDRIPTGAFGTLEQAAAAACYLAEPRAQRPWILAPTGGETLY